MTNVVASIKARSSLQHFVCIGGTVSTVCIEVLSSTPSLTHLCLCGIQELSDEMIGMVCVSVCACMCMCMCVCAYVCSLCVHVYACSICVGVCVGVYIVTELQLCVVHNTLSYTHSTIPPHLAPIFPPSPFFLRSIRSHNWQAGT